MSWHNDPTALAAMVAAILAGDVDGVIRIIREHRVEEQRADQEAETWVAKMVEGPEDKTSDEDQGAKRDHEEEHGVETMAAREEAPMRKPMSGKKAKSEDAKCHQRMVES